MSLADIAKKMIETLPMSEIVDKAAEAATVILSETAHGSKVSEERLRKRYEVCKACPHIKVLPTTELYCNYCKCPISVDRKIINRARYSTVSCPDPKGDRWAANDC